MKVKVSSLTGQALDWAVAKCEGVSELVFSLYYEPTEATDFDSHGKPEFHYSTMWHQAGPIIERESISIIRCDDDYQNFPDKWMAQKGAHSYCESTEHQQHDPMIQLSVENDGSCFSKDGPMYGPTPLVAAMRCFVANTLGERVDVPDWTVS